MYRMLLKKEPCVSCYDNLPMGSVFGASVNPKLDSGFHYQSGTPVGTMKLNDLTVEQIISKTVSVNNKLDTLTRTISDVDLKFIESIWIANEAKAYTDKVHKAIKKVEEVNKAILLLRNTYTDAIVKQRQTQQDVSSSINNI